MSYFNKLVPIKATNDVRDKLGCGFSRKYYISDSYANRVADASNLIEYIETKYTGGVNKKLLITSAFATSIEITGIQHITESYAKVDFKWNDFTISDFECKRIRGCTNEKQSIAYFRLYDYVWRLEERSENNFYNSD